MFYRLAIALTIDDRWPGPVAHSLHVYHYCYKAHILRSSAAVRTDKVIRNDLIHVPVRQSLAT